MSLLVVVVVVVGVLIIPLKDVPSLPIKPGAAAGADVAEWGAQGGIGGPATLLQRLRALGRRELGRGTGGSDPAHGLCQFVQALVTCIESGLTLSVALELVADGAPPGRPGHAWGRMVEHVRRAAGDAPGVGLLGGPGTDRPRTWLVPKHAVGADARVGLPIGASLLGGAVTLSTRTGAPLAAVLRSVDAVVRDVAAGAGRARVLVAGPMATMGLLTALPVLGPFAIWALGWPVSQLYSGSALAGAVVGGGLTASGWAWSRRLLRRAARPTRLPPRPDRPHGHATVTDVGDAITLLALALCTGAGVTECIEQVADLVSGRVAADLRVAAAARRWGCPPGAEWFMAGPVWRELALAASAADRAGAAPSGLVMTAATRLREQEQRAVEERIQRAAVLLVLPLGVCFLPGFLLTTVLPPVLAVAGRLL